MNNKITILSFATIVGIMTLSLLAAKPLTNQAFGQFGPEEKSPTHITISLDPDRNKGGYGESAPTTVSGKLTYDSVYDLHTKTYSNPLPLAGVDIIIHFPSKGVTVKTDSSGAYSEPYTVTFTACKMVFEVAYHGSDRYSTASADATYHLDRLHGPCPGT